MGHLTSKYVRAKGSKNICKTRTCRVHHIGPWNCSHGTIFLGIYGSTGNGDGTSRRAAWSIAGWDAATFLPIAEEAHEGCRMNPRAPLLQQRQRHWTTSFKTSRRCTNRSTLAASTISLIDFIVYWTLPPVDMVFLLGFREESSRKSLV